VEVTTSTYDSLNTIVKKNRIKKMGFDPLNLPYEVAERLASYIRPARLTPAKKIIENLRAVKDIKEIEAVKRSINVTGDVLKKVAGMIRPGISERSISDFIEYEFIKRGARIAFETIAACGRNCSKPHAHATTDRITNNDVVMLDMGCRLNLYNSDITRIFFIGKVKEKIKEIYGIVRAAQNAAIEKIKPGVKISEIDNAGRGYIAQKGYGKFFSHSLGHGVGMDVHEEPGISKRNDNILKSGMIFTVEPAIYLPKFGGVRIEDMVLVTDKGCEVLTR
jgi:Xaa-Pro aminopeptidase